MRRSWQPGTASAIHLRGNWWTSAAIGCICTALGRAAQLLCSMLAWEGSPSTGVRFSPRSRRRRVCAYDRAGLGWSEPGPAPRSPQQFASELRALLTNGGVEGPYVLVAHSLSGKTARLFASQHPDEVAGMVLVDARHEYVDDHRAPEQLAAEDAEQRQFQNMIRWMARFGAGASAVGARVAERAGRQ
jgi:pimeloyl-ACP methyl ester carboxylesterase